MEFVRSIFASTAMILAGLLIGCPQESRETQISEKSTRPKEFVAVAAEEPAEEVVVASATLLEPATGSKPATSDDAPREITLRDANIATQMIAQYFPIRDMQLSYFGGLSATDHMNQTLTALHLPSERCWWVLHRRQPDDLSLVINFELLAARRTDEDIPLQVAVDRTVFVHINRCNEDGERSYAAEEFEIDGVVVAELFRRCDEKAIWHWERLRREEEVWQRINEIEEEQAEWIAESNSGSETADVESTEDNSDRPRVANVHDTNVRVLPQSFRRFICRPLDEMIDELQMTGPCLAGIVFGSASGGRSFWVSPEFPDHYIDVYCKNDVEGKTVMSIRLQDRERRE